MNYSVITFGCRVNQADSLALEAELLAKGCRPSAAPQADVVIVNTCSVTASADQGARQTIRRIARQNPQARIVVTGCYASRRPGEIAALPGVERVVPNSAKDELISLLQLGANTPSQTRDVTTAERFGGGEGSCGARLEPGLAGRTAFTLRVQTGCSEPCAYCIIPATRGEPRSAPLDRIIRDLDFVFGAGFKEVVLTGVHLGSYGRDLSPAMTLVDLLDGISSGRGGAVRFRVSSLEPMDCSTEVVSLIAERPAFAAHFHLPLQHASDRLLAAMRRPYTLFDYDALVTQIRRRLPDAAIGSDVIVGFPGETDQDFDVLERFLEQSPLTHLHVFPYSDRPGTAATAMSKKVPGEIVRERAHRIRHISDGLVKRFRAGQVGTQHRALTLDDGSTVVTGNYLKLSVPKRVGRNEWVDIRVSSEVHGELLTD
jgi:threonylcarbamoyladenosine tRNA methylthiotransferase MtaB